LILIRGFTLIMLSNFASAAFNLFLIGMTSFALTRLSTCIVIAVSSMIGGNSVGTSGHLNMK